MSVAIRYTDILDMNRGIMNAHSFNDLQSQVSELREAAVQIQAMAKAQNPTGRNLAARGPKSVFFDPLDLQYALGYKDRRHSLTYDTLRRVAQQVAVVSAIINTRIAQIAAFSEPYRLTKSLGFQIKHKSPHHLTTDAERDFIEYLEAFILSCGEPGKENPFTRLKRPKFENYLKMVVRDSLELDQIGTEVVPRRDKIPFEFRPVDGATLRIASPDRDVNVSFSYHNRNSISPWIQPHRSYGLYENQFYGQTEPVPTEPIRYVQVVNGQIENVYGDELAFGVRSPRTCIYCFVPDTGVLLDDFSECSIDNISVGQKVITHTSKSSSVKKVFKRQYDGNLINISTRSTRDSIKCTPEHPFLAIKNDNLRHLVHKEAQLSWVPAKELEEGHYLAIPKINCKEKEWVIDIVDYVNNDLISFDEYYVWNTKFSYQKNGLIKRAEAIEKISKLSGVHVEAIKRYLYRPEDYRKVTRDKIEDACHKLSIDFSDFIFKIPRRLIVDEDVAMLFGLWEAEGSIVGKYVSFSFHEDEFYLVDIVREFAYKLSISYTEGFNNSNRGRYITLQSNILGYLFCELFGKGQKERKIPKELFSCHRLTKYKFIEGFLLGDGSYSIRKGVPSISTSVISRTLIKHIEILLNTLGIYVYGYLKIPERNVVNDDGSVSIYNAIYGFDIYGKHAFLFDSTLGYFSDIKVEYSKKSRGLHYLESDNYFYVRISKIDKCAYSGPVYNLNVEGDNSYVTRYAVHNCQGYGYAEIEQLITVMTSILYAEEYNRNIFKNGSNPKGLLNFKGDNWTPDQLSAFKTQWRASVQGVHNAWVTPITQSEGIEWIDLQRSSQEMGYQGWIEYNLKLACAIWLIDPAEINFDLHGGVQQTPLFESSQEWKLKASRDRGLKPLLKFFARQINENIIDLIDDHYCFEFAGLDELTEQEKHELAKEQVASYKTLNEIRRELDLPEIEGKLGDVPLNPTLIQYIQMQQTREDQFRQEKKQEEQQKKEEAMQQQQMQQQASMQQGAPQEEMDPKKEQDVRHAEDKHPLEMQLLQQKVDQGSVQDVVPEMAGTSEGQPQAGVPVEQQGQIPVEAAVPEEKPRRKKTDSRKDYTALLGKSVGLDDFIDYMRARQ